MRKSDSRNFLVVLDLEHGGEEAPGGGPEQDLLLLGLGHHQPRVGDRYPVDTKLGDRSRGHRRDGQSAANC